MLCVLLLHKYTHSRQIVCPDFCFEDIVILTAGHLQRLRGSSEAIPGLVWGWTGSSGVVMSC